MSKVPLSEHTRENEFYSAFACFCIPLSTVLKSLSEMSKVHLSEHTRENEFYGAFACFCTLLHAFVLSFKVPTLFAKNYIK